MTERRSFLKNSYGDELTYRHPLFEPISSSLNCVPSSFSHLAADEQASPSIRSGPTDVSGATLYRIVDFFLLSLAYL